MEPLMKKLCVIIFRVSGLQYLSCAGGCLDQTLPRTRLRRNWPFNHKLRTQTQNTRKERSSCMIKRQLYNSENSCFLNRKRRPSCIVKNPASVQCTQIVRTASKTFKRRKQSVDMHTIHVKIVSLEDFKNRTIWICKIVNLATRSRKKKTTKKNESSQKYSNVTSRNTILSDNKNAYSLKIE